MLDREDRFYAPSGAIYPGGPSTWNVIDWDQRRLVSVKMDQEQESPDVAFACLLKHIDHLPPDTYLVHLSPEGDLLSSSNDPEDDETLCPFRPSLDAAQLPPGIMTASRADLQEVARLGPNVYLVVYRNSMRPDDKHLSFNWHEMCLWCRLKHPNIVPFDKVIVDELEGRLVGFTSKYVPGGTLDENKTRLFKLKWLHQLTDVVDELNLNLGVAHQDVAPRNILIDESIDMLMLFDFNFSARIGRPGYSEPRNDVKGVIFTMYEVITRDQARRDKIHEDQDVSAVQELAWDKHPDVRLDHPVSEFRRVLDEWCERRREGPQITINTQAPNFIDWPPLPDPPLTETTVDRGPELGLEPLGKIVKRDYWERKELLRQGKTVLNWQRPAQKWPETGDKSNGVSDVAKQ